MKQILFIFFFFPFFINAQNIGIGTAEPVNKLHVIGNLLVIEPTVTSNTSPTALQTKTLVNANTIFFNGTDSTGVIYDPGGAAGNYSDNLIAYASINAIGSCAGFELDFQEMDLEVGDSVIIKESSASQNPTWYAVGNGYTTTGKITISGSAFYLISKSNNDGINGAGFALIYKRLYSNTQQPGNITAFAGKNMFYDANKSAFRVGLTNNAVRGFYSLGSGYLVTASGLYSHATGYGTKATSDYSTAMGANSTASGIVSTAMGNSTAASGVYSTAMGSFTVANSYGSTAMGYNTTAGGIYSFAQGSNSNTNGTNAIAMGYNTSASGNNSIALGSYVSSVYTGSLIIGDASTTTSLGIVSNNSFRARFVNGYGFFTGTNIGVYVPAGGNSWVAFSDVRAKENFIPVDGENFLKSIANMPQYTWNYKTQDPKTFRHYGPMAQDFYKAFGKDDLGEIGCDTLINQQDFLGVNLIAIQALEKRTTKLQQENDALKEKNKLLDKRLNKLEMLINKK